MSHQYISILDKKTFFSRDETIEQRTAIILSIFDIGSWPQVFNVLRIFAEDDDNISEESFLWNFRSSSLSVSLAKALVFLRDKNEIKINVATIKDKLIFNNFISLVTQIEPTNENKFLTDMPGYLDSSPQQSNDFMDAYGYLQMRFYSALSQLEDDIHWCKCNSSTPFIALTPQKV